MGGFSIISLLYVALGVRVVWMIAQNWRSVWDRNFTPHDRVLVNQASFFFLIPLSVVLHDFGHAVAVWGFGKEIGVSMALRDMLPTCRLASPMCSKPLSPPQARW